MKQFLSRIYFSLGLTLLATAVSVLTGISEAQAQNPRTRGGGTAFVVHPDGYLATCYHVVNSASNIMVVLTDSEGQQKLYKAEVQVVDPANDLAILKIELQNLTPLPLLPDSVKTGQDALVIGYPLAATLGQSAKMNRGMVSGFVNRHIQIDAPINPGNSGGPLLDKSGMVVGVASAKLAGFVISNVGLCIEVSALQTLMAENGIAPVIDSGKAEELTPEEIFRRCRQSIAFVQVTRDAQLSAQAAAGLKNAGTDAVTGTRPQITDFTDGFIVSGGKVVVPPDQVGKAVLKNGQFWLAPGAWAIAKAQNGLTDEQAGIGTGTARHGNSDDDSFGIGNSSDDSFGIGNSDDDDSVGSGNHGPRSGRVVRQACPEETQLLALTKQMEVKYQDQKTEAGTPGKRTALIRTLIADSARESVSSKRLAILNLARTWSIAHGDAAQTRRIVKMMTDGWSMDRFTAERSSFMAVGQKVQSKMQWAAIGDWAIELFADAVERDEMALAEKLDRIIRAADTKAEDEGFTGRAAEHMKWREFVLAAYRQTGESLSIWGEEDTAKKTPMIHRYIGLYRCFVNRNFKEGLPILEKSDTEDFRAVARLERAGTRAPGQCMAVGDLWWKLAQQYSDSVFCNIMTARAIFWYNNAVALGASKLLSEDDIKQMSKRLSQNIQLLKEYEFEDLEKMTAESATGDAAVDQRTSVSVADPINTASTVDIYTYVQNQAELKNYINSPLTGNTFNGVGGESIRKPAGIMVGMDVTFNTQQGVSSITPIYKVINKRTKAVQLVRGSLIGYPGTLAPSTVMAKEGYALAGISIVGSSSLEGCGGIQLLFARIGDKGLNTDDKYMSAFVGRGSPQTAASFSTNGGMIVGLHGRISDAKSRQILAMGVIVVPPME